MTIINHVRDDEKLFKNEGCTKAPPYTYEKGEERYYKGGWYPLGSLLSGMP